MLFDNIHQIRKILSAVEDLSLPVHNILLQIICRRFRNTEILHRIRHGNPQFLTNSEEMINSVSAGENNSLVIQNIDFGLPELSGINTFHMNKRAKIDFYLVVVSKIEIRRFI